MNQLPRKKIPGATVSRLPVYLRILESFLDDGLMTVSSERLADVAAVNPPKVRKDLSYLGTYGTRGVGYDVEYLVYQISRELGLTQDWPVVVIGTGNLGTALANYKGFGLRGFRIVALLDSDKARVGKKLAGLTIQHVDDLKAVVDEIGVPIGLIATPVEAAQGTADRLVQVGVRSILNFAPAVLVVPEGIRVRQVDLSVELQILAHYEQTNTLRKSRRS